jgi:hypothetical protein
MIKVILGRLGVIFESFRILIVQLGLYLGGALLPLPAITTSSLLPVVILIVVIVLLLSSNLFLWSILRLPLRLWSYRLILWRIATGHSVVTQILSDLWSLSLSPLLLILSDILMMLILLGVILTHSILILGVLSLALFTFLITIFIEAITSSALRGV